MIEAVIFDMDGLLIDSEPLWQQAEIDIFTPLGVPLTIDMTLQTTGLRTDEVVEYWYKRYPWESSSLHEVSVQIDQTITAMALERGVAKPGVDHAIELCTAAGLPMAIASSSSRTLIDAVVQKLGIGEHLTLIHSAHDESHGKPHPAVYITTAEKLGIEPSHCLAFEDSVNGVLSAKAAKMKCIAVPEPALRDDKRLGIADAVLNSLEDLTPAMFGR